MTPAEVNEASAALKTLIDEHGGEGALAAAGLAAKLPEEVQRRLETQLVAEILSRGRKPRLHHRLGAKLFLGVGRLMNRRRAAKEAAFAGRPRALELHDLEQAPLEDLLDSLAFSRVWRGARFSLPVTVEGSFRLAGLEEALADYRPNPNGWDLYFSTGQDRLSAEHLAVGDTDLEAGSGIVTASLTHARAPELPPELQGRDDALTGNLILVVTSALGERRRTDYVQVNYDTLVPIARALGLRPVSAKEVRDALTRIAREEPAPPPKAPR